MHYGKNIPQDQIQQLQAIREKQRLAVKPSEDRKLRAERYEVLCKLMQLGLQKEVLYAGMESMGKFFSCSVEDAWLSGKIEFGGEDLRVWE